MRWLDIVLLVIVVLLLIAGLATYLGLTTPEQGYTGPFEPEARTPKYGPWSWLIPLSLHGVAYGIVWIRWMRQRDNSD